MAGEKYIAGDLGNLAVYDGEAYKPVACLTSSALSSALEMREKVNMCNPGQTVKSPGNITQEVQIDGEVVDTTDVGGGTAKESFDELLDRQKASRDEGVPDKWRLSRGPLGYKYFDAYISNVSDNWSAGEDATFSATMDIQGLVTDEDPNE